MKEKWIIVLCVKSDSLLCIWTEVWKKQPGTRFTRAESLLHLAPSLFQLWLNNKLLPACPAWTPRPLAHWSTRVPCVIERASHAQFVCSFICKVTFTANPMRVSSFNSESTYRQHQSSCGAFWASGAAQQSDSSVIWALWHVQSSKIRVSALGMWRAQGLDHRVAYKSNMEDRSGCSHP